jgi:hypothetical protein
MIRKKPQSVNLKDQFIHSATAEQETHNITSKKQYTHPYDLKSLDINWEEGSNCGKNLTINLTEKEWNTLHHHVMSFGNGNKARWIKYYLFKAIAQEQKDDN